ncbi:MAG: hypothetical protein J6565_08145 [Lactobacillus sp.]|nr:hypothetical protein [Lactobacillus sp.]
MINKTQVLWGYIVVECVCRGFAESITWIFKFKPEMASLITTVFFVMFVLKFKVKPMKESNYLFAFMIQDRRAIEKNIVNNKFLSDSERIIAQTFVTLRINYQKSKELLVDNKPGMELVTSALDIFRNYEHDLH